MEDRPRISTLLNSLANYSNTIPGPPSDPDAKPAAGGARMGTLIGVYLPCIQNIFGVILFIRLTWVVGTAGAICGFCIVLTCCCVVSSRCLIIDVRAVEIGINSISTELRGVCHQLCVNILEALLLIFDRLVGKL